MRFTKCIVQCANTNRDCLYSGRQSISVYLILRKRETTRQQTALLATLSTDRFERKSSGSVQFQGLRVWSLRGVHKQAQCMRSRLAQRRQPQSIVRAQGFPHLPMSRLL